MVGHRETEYSPGEVRKKANLATLPNTLPKTWCTAGIAKADG